MNKPFTEIPLPPKERMIVRLYFTKAPADSVNHCETCHALILGSTAKVQRPPLCACCGRLLCWTCFGHDGLVPIQDREVKICDDCAEMEEDEIGAVLELRQKLGGAR